MATIDKPIRPTIEAHDREVIQRGFRCGLPVPKGTADYLMEEADAVVNRYLRDIKELRARYRSLAGGAEWDNRRGRRLAP